RGPADPGGRAHRPGGDQPVGDPRRPARLTVSDNGPSYVSAASHRRVKACGAEPHTVVGVAERYRCPVTSPRSTTAPRKRRRPRFSPRAAARWRRPGRPARGWRTPPGGARWGAQNPDGPRATTDVERSGVRPVWDRPRRAGPPRTDGATRPC